MVITTAKRYEHDITTDSGLVLTSRMEGNINDFQVVVAVGEQCRGLNVGDVVHINFMRYAQPVHKSAGVQDGTNTERDMLSVQYQIPMVEIDGQQCLKLRYNDIEFVAEVEVDGGGLLQ